MSNMLDILKKFDAVQNFGQMSHQKLNECGDMSAAPAPSTPVTVNITAPNAQDMAAMLKALASIESGAAPTTPLAIAADKMEAEFESPCDMKQEESYVNEPDEEYADHNFMTKDLSGGINRQKKMYPPAAKGDNPMAVESIKDRLIKALNEKKAKPDFLDMDKDGNKKEPMKKAVADKKKPAVSESDDDLEYAKKYLRHLQRTDASSAKIEAQRKKIADMEKSKTNESDIAKTISDKLKKSKPSYRDPNAKLDKEERAFGKKPVKKHNVKEGSKPDFLDMDKDGNKKEPMKKAIKDKKVKEATVTEGRRLVKKVENGNRAVKIYWDGEWGEFIVQHYENGQYMKDADYFDSDKEGAVDTAKHFLQGAGM